MSNKDQVIDNETGEVFGGDEFQGEAKTGETLAALIPYNRMLNIARATLTRMDWDKKEGLWVTDIGETDEITGEIIKATEVYSCWSEQVGKPTCQGFGPACPNHPETSQMGYRLAIASDEFGNVWVDLYGLAQSVGSAACKFAAASGGKIHFKGSKAISTQNGTFYIPKLVR